jgi:hypothetical protein
MLISELVACMLRSLLRAISSIDAGFGDVVAFIVARLLRNKWCQM